MSQQSVMQPIVGPFVGNARVPAPGDNAAIATRRLEAGSVLELDDGRKVTLSHTLLEGHRFVLDPVAKGDSLRSWGLPFGTARRDIAPGEYVCNARILDVLADRHVDFDLPEAPNFDDAMQRYTLDEAAFTPGDQVPRAASPRTFDGFRRPGGRGVGTRNHVVVIGLTANETALADALSQRFAGTATETFDGVVPVSHTEGGSAGVTPNNLDFVLRVLAGFVVHPNTAAVMVLDQGAGAYDNATLEAFMRDNGYPLDAVPHRFVSVAGDAHAALDSAAAVIEGWLPEIVSQARTPAPLTELKIALQCGGSDAFSGVSGNALAGYVARLVIENGGSANLAETDELIGAEPYVLDNVRDFATAEDFLRRIDVFKERVSWHGASAEGNPSGGNNFRGLYNIALKSIGAARKRDPDVRLDYVIDYGAPMAKPGYYFMDSPGNDLESIAGQVAAGCNLIFFITGNGSITNFPFAPTLKFVTTSGRFELLADEMDVNAGRYADGEPMDALGAETFEQTLAVASGERSKGELAGHSQVSIWRDWPQTGVGALAVLSGKPEPDGEPLGIETFAPATLEFDGYAAETGFAADQIGLVMPTSLCSGQVARLAAEALDGRPDKALSRFVALVHTEGCGSANAESHYLATLFGHITHPAVRAALMLEHGCEKTHNDAVRNYLADVGCDAERFGYASVQLDGGLVRVTDKVEQWFDAALAERSLPARERAGAGGVRIALVSDGAPGDALQVALARLAGGLAAAGARVVMAEGDSLLGSPAFERTLLGDRVPRPTLGYAGVPTRGGLHVMQMPTRDRTECITGLAASGVQSVFALAQRAAWPAHPFVPVVQLAEQGDAARRAGADLEHVFDAGLDSDRLLSECESLVVRAASGEIVPRRLARGLTQFQLTRGLLGVSM